MESAVALIYYKYNDFNSKSYYDTDMSKVISSFEQDIKRKHQAEVLWAYLYDKDGNVIKSFKRIL